jgi:hypothetical protein
MNLKEAEQLYDEVEKHERDILCDVSTSDIQEESCLILDARCIFDFEHKKDRYDFLVTTKDGEKWIACWGINI